VFSLGFQNIFNLPNKKVIERYQDMGSHLYRTDQDGAITIETDGSDVMVKTFPGREVY
jgi:competence protein ComEC